MITLCIILTVLILIGAAIVLLGAFSLISPILLIILFLPLVDLVVIRIYREIKGSKKDKKED